MTDISTFTITSASSLRLERRRWRDASPTKTQYFLPGLFLLSAQSGAVQAWRRGCRIDSSAGRASVLVPGLEVVDGAEDLFHIRRRADLVENVLHALVGHGALVQGGLAHRGGVDPRHLLFERRHRKGLPGVRPAHQAARPVGGGEVPVRIALPHAEQAPVPHIDGDEQPLPRFGGDGALPQDPGVGVDVVVDRGKLLHHVELHPLDDHVHHGLPVEHGEALDDPHVVDVLRKQVPGHIGQGLGDAGLPGVFQPLDLLGNLLLPAFRLHPGDERLDGGVVGAVERLVPRLLVVAGHLHPQAAAAGVNHQVEVSVVVPVHLDEVVAAAQRADAPFRPEQIHMAGAAQLRQVDLAEIGVRAVPDGEAGGDLLLDQLVQLLEFQPPLPDADGLHAAADVHPHKVRHHLVGDGHGGANGAARPGVDVGHQPDAAARREFLVAQLLHLGDGRAVHHIGKDLGLVVLSANLDHSVPFRIWGDFACQAVFCGRAASPPKRKRRDRARGCRSVRPASRFRAGTPGRS